MTATADSGPQMLPDLTMRLRDPSGAELRRLLRRIQRRTTMTPLEQVAREVGPAVYARLQVQFYEVNVVLRRGRIIGLPAGVYGQLLQETIHQRELEFRRPPNRLS